MTNEDAHLVLFKRLTDSNLVRPEMNGNLVDFKSDFDENSTKTDLFGIEKLPDCLNVPMKFQSIEWFPEYFVVWKLMINYDGKLISKFNHESDDVVHVGAFILFKNKCQVVVFLIKPDGIPVVVDKINVFDEEPVGQNQITITIKKLSSHSNMSIANIKGSLRTFRLFFLNDHFLRIIL